MDLTDFGNKPFDSINPTKVGFFDSINPTKVGLIESKGLFPKSVKSIRNA